MTLSFPYLETNRLERPRRIRLKHFFAAIDQVQSGMEGGMRPKNFACFGYGAGRISWSVHWLKVVDEEFIYALREDFARMSCIVSTETRG